MRWGKLSFKLAIAISLLSSLSVLILLTSFFFVRSSPLKTLRERVKALSQQRDELALRVAMREKRSKPDKEVALKFINSMKKVLRGEIKQVSETQDDIVVTMNLYSKDFSTLLFNVERNYPFVRLRNLSLEPVNSDKLFLYFTLRAYQGGKLKKPEEKELYSPWLSQESFRDYLISIGVINPEPQEEAKLESEVPQNQTPEVEKQKEELSLEEVLSRFKEEYTLKGVLIIGDKASLIVTRNSDGKILKLKEGDALPLILNEETLKIELKRITFSEVEFQVGGKTFAIPLKG